MRILMVNKFLYPRGGSETYMFELSDYLMKMGHDVQFFGMYDRLNTVDMEEQLLVNNLNFHSKSLHTLLYPFKIIYSREAYKKIKYIINSFKPDIVHLNNYNFQLTPSILYAIKELNIPVVQTVHDPVLVCPAHILYNFQSGQVCEKCKGRKYYSCIKTRCIHGSLIKSVLGALEGYVYYKSGIYDYITSFICPSHFIANKIIEFGMPDKKISVLRNFLGEKSLNPKVQKKEQILYFGRLSKEKGIGTLLSAVEALKNIHFVIAGDGPLVNDLSKYSNLEYVGFKKGDELSRLIQESLFTLCPSECYENCPMSILESYGLGTPVIGANIGGIPELVKDQYSGLLFEPGNTSDLISKIELLYKNRELLASFTNRCKEEITQFSIDRYYQSIMEIYSNAIVKSCIPEASTWKH